MEVENPELRQFLNNCLFTLYFLDSQKYSNYKLNYISNAKYKYAGKYIPAEKQLVIVDHDFYNKELLYCTALHELAHHVQYINEGTTNHNASFKAIHKALLEAAFKNDDINPSKLLLSELYLITLSEQKRITKICNDYIQQNEVKMFYMEVSETEPQNVRVKFKYNESLGMYYRFMPERLKTKTVAGLVMYEEKQIKKCPRN